MSSTSPRATSDGEWLVDWDPENEATWDSPLAWRTLWVTTFCLTLAFVAWFLPSAIIPKLNPLGYQFTKDQLYWMAAMPGLAAGPAFCSLRRSPAQCSLGRSASRIGAAAQSAAARLVRRP